MANGGLVKAAGGDRVASRVLSSVYIAVRMSRRNVMSERFARGTGCRES